MPTDLFQFATDTILKIQTCLTTRTKNKTKQQKTPDDYSNEELIMDTITETCVLTLENSYFNYKW